MVILCLRWFVLSHNYEIRKLTLEAMGKIVQNSKIKANDILPNQERMSSLLAKSNYLVYKSSCYVTICSLF